MLAPQFHKGLVLKHNVNQRYATNSVSASLFRCVPHALQMQKCLNRPCAWARIGHVPDLAHRPCASCMPAVSKCASTSAMQSRHWVESAFLRLDISEDNP